jgi:hypothetical protein
MSDSKKASTSSPPTLSRAAGSVCSLMPVTTRTTCERVLLIELADDDGEMLIH